LPSTPVLDFGRRAKDNLLDYYSKEVAMPCCRKPAAKKAAPKKKKVPAKKKAKK